VKVVRHKTAAEFLAKAGDWLEQAEAENNLILGIAAFFASCSGQVQAEPYFLTAQDDDMVVAAALMTPPHRLLITRMPDPAVTLLAEHLLAERASVPGVLGPRECARLFAENWVGRTGSSSRLKMRERIYACESIISPMSSRGHLRTATLDDEPLLFEWAGEFCREAKIADETAYTQAQIPTTIARERLYVWDDGEPVSMADLRRETAHGIAVSLVYTPPRWRNRGYASSCVASLTKRMLDDGKRFCCLFTDLANPTSNSVYQRIGYGEICDVDDWIFE
jgi:predicted GNAT family acetyltransferase